TTRSSRGSPTRERRVRGALESALPGRRNYCALGMGQLGAGGRDLAAEDALAREGGVAGTCVDDGGREDGGAVGSEGVPGVVALVAGPGPPDRVGARPEVVVLRAHVDLGVRHRRREVVFARSVVVANGRERQRSNARECP